jgi:hypothetical protein
MMDIYTVWIKGKIQERRKGRENEWKKRAFMKHGISIGLFIYLFW